MAADNNDLCYSFMYPGVRDSSGMTFTYTATRRQHDAGILFMGHQVGISQIIPPNANNYSSYGVCPGLCTQQVKYI